jgi:hypothetical protein
VGKQIAGFRLPDDEDAMIKLYRLIPVIAFALISWFVIVIGAVMYKCEIASSSKFLDGEITLPVVQICAVFPCISSAVSSSKLVNVVNVAEQQESSLTLSHQRQYVDCKILLGP